MADLTLLTICGSLRKGSYNAMVQRGLPSLAPEGMTIKAAPSFAKFSLYNADVQDANGFPGAVNTLADAIRAADGVIIVSPEYNFSWRLEKRHRLGVPAAELTLCWQAYSVAISIARAPWGRTRSI